MGLKREMIDILITTYNRKEFLKKTIESLFEKTKMEFRLFIIDDCSDDGTQDYLRNLEHERLTFVVLSKRRNGVVFGFNMLWNMIDYYDMFWEEKPYLCYLQDDCFILEDGWLWILLDAYEKLKEKFNIGFFSGYDAPEHPIRERLIMEGREMFLKDSQTATNLIATKEFWRSIGWIPRRNPDGSERGFPGKNKGSHIDLYLTGCMSESKFVRGAAGENCSYNQKKKVLVIPMIEHLGIKDKESTWRNGT